MTKKDELLLATGIGILGFVMIWMATNFFTAAGALLMLWGNNIEQKNK